VSLLLLCCCVFLQEVCHRVCEPDVLDVNVR
jgi:hypothetical protein